jgi:hypothetical protein
LEQRQIHAIPPGHVTTQVIGLAVPVGVGVVVGVVVVGVQPGIGVQRGSLEPNGRTQTLHPIVTVCAGCVVEVIIVVGVLEIVENVVNVAVWLRKIIRADCALS